jgi:hypothetical protein
MIKEFLEMLDNTTQLTESDFGTNRKLTYSTRKVVKTITTTTKTLIEDEQLVKDLVDFCKGKYCLNRREMSAENVRDLLTKKFYILNINKYNESTDEFDDEPFEMEYPSYDYQLEYPDAEPTARKHSFNDVLWDFIDQCPDKCKWETKVDTETIAED